MRDEHRALSNTPKNAPIHGILLARVHSKKFIGEAPDMSVKRIAANGIVTAGF